MTSTSPTQNHSYFLTEAQDLLQTIEQGVFSLRSDRTPAKVHELMRAAHTLKGAAASVGLNAINNVAHVLEDIFRAFYNPDVEVDTEIEGLLFQGYECLRLLLTAQLNGTHVDESEALNRAASIIARLQEKLGDSFDRDAPIPTSAEMGFDMVQSMFEIGVTQRIEELSHAIATQSPGLSDLLRMHTEIFLGLAESLQLPGFEAIARATLTALEHQPEQIQHIAEVALADFSRGQALVLDGDRQQGGAPSPALLQLASGRPSGEPAWETAIPDNSDPRSWQRSPAPPQVPHASARSFLPTLVALLQTKIDLNLWLQQFRNWIAFQKTTAESEFQLPTAISEHPPLPINSVPPIALEDLLSNLHPQSLGSPNALTVEEGDYQSDAATLNSLTEPSNGEDFWYQQRLELDASERQNGVFNQPENLTIEPFELSDLPPPDAQTSAFNALESEEKQHPGSAYQARSTASSKPGGAPTASVRVELDKLETLSYLTGELLINQNEQVSQEDDLRLIVQELLAQLQKHQQTLNELCGQGDRLLLANRWQQGKSTQDASAILQQFDALEMDRYSEIHILSRSALHEAAELNSISESLEQTTRQFRQSLEAQQRLLFTVGNDLTAIRMQPLEELFNRLKQVIQQLAISHNKPIEVTVSGTHVLVDKTIVEKLYDPLLHLVRNAFDHGIEAPEVRQAKGKPALGRIEIDAYHQGHHTVIEVKDDGPGIQLQRVAQRAIEMGWLQPDAIATTPQATLLSFLFEPGFSTAAQVSDLSGRGVGLDVVRAQSESFRGSVAVNFVPHQGTTFSLQIPLSLTIAKLLVCRDQGIAYALPLDAIEQIVSNPDSLSRVGQQQVLQWGKGDEAVTVAVRSLTDLMAFSNAESPNLALPTIEAAQAIAPDSIVLLRTSTGFMGVQVEQVLGEQELVIRPLGGAIAPPPYIYGCCIVGNSQLALVLDVRTLLQQETPLTQEQSYHSSHLLNANSDSGLAKSLPTNHTQNLISPTTSLLQSPANSSLDALIPTPVPPWSPQNLRILLIEDSLTLRQTLSQLLQAVGYQISQAKDGLEGLTFLQQDPGINLILCDIEMPRMNGFEFLSQRRQHSALSKIPVVMLTSRSSMKYRQFAMDLGAADFMTKPYVDQALLSTIQNLLAAS